MAKQKNMHFIGTIGNVIFYELNGGFYMRAKPATCEQTSATKKRSTNFAIASRAARVLRSLMLPVLPFPKDKVMQNRFTAVIINWLKQDSMNDLQPALQMPCFNKFQFNDKTSLSERFKVLLTVTSPEGNNIELNIPAFIPVQSIVAPADTVAVDCIINVASCLLKDGTPSGGFTTRLSFPYNDSIMNEQTLQIPVGKETGNLVVVSVGLVYYISRKGIIQHTTNPSWMPAAIIAAMFV